MAAAGIALAVVILVLGGIGSAIFFAVRGQGSGDSFTFRNLLRAYLRLAYMVSLVVFMVGAVTTLTAAFATTFGHQFSYGNDFSGNVTCTSITVNGNQQQNCRPVPTPGDDRRQKEDLIQGLSLLVAGLVIGGAHRVGQLSMESVDERRSSGLARAEYLIGTIGFGLVSIVALPAAAYSVLSYNLISQSPGSYNSGGDIPGPTLAVAIVFVPAWAYYLVSFVRRVRSQAATPAEPA